ncbi:hypothetical protein CesoFtcFv8_015898 [Champsocephalus esox]|uniref:Secreted protein n=1 Tax=Champsocephalus esox TaxID=159716 RepID=A0AAN8BLQ2_9TELE|nr:hypothetical protein CesoFtcFv8_015898 [Champsocephalus esox]
MAARRLFCSLLLSPCFCQVSRCDSWHTWSGLGLEQSVGSVLKANWVMVVRVLVRVRYDNDWKRSMTRSGGVTNQIKIKSVS